MLFSALICALLIFDKSGCMPIVLISCAAHESGHLAAMRLFGVCPDKIILSPIGASISANLNLLSCKERIITAAAGPFINLSAAGLLAAFGGERLNIAVFVNLALGIFNLLPAASFDGSHILRCILSAKCEPYFADKICKAVSIITLAAAVLTGVFLFAANKSNITLLLISSYMLILEFSRLKY